jgi:hypothetical protein
MIGTTFGTVAGLVELALSAVWLRLIYQVRIPADRRPILVGHALALGLGVAALAAGADVTGSVLAVVAVLGGLTWLVLAAQSAQARPVPAVAVGGPVIDFTLPDHRGVPFDLATMRGKPFLLKFFRGHW